MSTDERLVPASVRGQVIHVTCPRDWCAVDHAARDEHFIEDISHMSEGVSVSAPVGLSGQEDILVGYVSQWTFAGEKRPIFALDATGNGEFSELSKTQATAFLDQLATHLDKLRAEVAKLPEDNQ